jgi:hypothetical protein
LGDQIKTFFYIKEKKMLSKDTGLRDSEREPIFVGDILKSKYEYLVLVCEGDFGNGYYGSLICEIEHSCRNIPYSLNDGKDYTIIVMANRI